jgi:hypothetical protein
MSQQELAEEADVDKADVEAALPPLSLDAEGAARLPDAGALAGQRPGADEEPEEASAAPQGGEPPFELPFAPLERPFTFWADAAALLLVGGALGAFG